ncbi:hypothetical protein PMAYCL1PPCAC_17265 [Pristionchus mayeri]|uniref:AMP-binding protein n=1 Tax=Pristionchus mayeri TaxID=1317129 RepID=A0AAN5I0B0_9BILA|nr:hypothetical protein PMAYCL1PPCAC_17265 [Pristionchus mayeri]
MIYESPFGKFPTCDIPVHQFVLGKIDEVIRVDPDRAAFVSSLNTYTQTTLISHHIKTLSVAQFLHDRGFVKQIACTVTSNCPEYLPFFLGVSIQGGALTGASAVSTEAELHRQFVDSGCSVILTDERNFEKTRQAANGLPAIKTIIIIGPVSAIGVFSWRDVIATKALPNRSYPAINVKDDVVFLPYSSGTTGVPKGVMLTHLNLGTMLNIAAMIRSHHRQAQGRDPDENETQLNFLPYYHAYGFLVMVIGVVSKCTAVTMTKFEPDLFCLSIQDYKIQSINVVPPILVFLAKDPRCSKYDLTSLKAIGCGAAPAGKSLIDEVKRRYPHVEIIKQSYGMTELTSGSHLADSQSVKKFGCCGKLAPGLQMKIVDPSTGRILPQGEAGEICIRGPTVMKGYLRRERETRETLRDGWLHTGDIGYCDADGDLFIVDRLKELIKVNGLQVAPAELESLLLTHPSISDVAVVGIPDDAAGELPKAYVVRKDRALTEKEVISFVHGKVSSYKQLKGGVEFIHEIPKSESGKILRRQLRDRLRSKV